MAKTVKELADEFTVSKQAISKLLTKTFRDNYVTTVITNGRKTLVVSDGGYDQLKRHFDNKINRQPSGQSVDSEYTANLVDELKKQIVFQQEELAIKNEQLNNKDTQIQSLYKLLDQSQQLQLMAENKIKQLESKNTDESSKKEDQQSKTETSNVEQPVAKDERGFWSRLFNR